MQDAVPKYLKPSNSLHCIDYPHGVVSEYSMPAVSKMISSCKILLEGSSVHGHGQWTIVHSMDNCP